jgi:integrase
VKFVRNILSGSLQAMLGDAQANEVIGRDPFKGLKWPDWTPPDARPFAAAERDAVLAWFAARAFRQRAEQGGYVKRPYPVYHAFVYLLFWTGMRPSEAVALRRPNLDLDRGVLFVRASRTMGETGAPKTKQARRTVELSAETIDVLRALPAHPSGYVFTTITGQPIEQSDFTNSHWYDCLAELDLTKRGLYSTKDTFVTLAMQAGCKPGWLEEQTGVSWSTLKRHYAKWATGHGKAEFALMSDFEAEVSPVFSSGGDTKIKTAGATGSYEVVPRGFEPLLPT